MKGDKKILMLGSMMELGTESQHEHAFIISEIDKHKWEAVVLVGKGFEGISDKYINYENAYQAKKWLEKVHPENAQILIKGSRSMQMEKVLECFCRFALLWRVVRVAEGVPIHREKVCIQGTKPEFIF